MNTSTIPSTPTPGKAIRISRRETRQWLIDTRPDCPDLVTSLAIVDLVRDAIAFGRQLERWPVQDAPVELAVVAKTDEADHCPRCRHVRCDAHGDYADCHIDSEYSGARGCYVVVARCHSKDACISQGGMRA